MNIPIAGQDYELKLPKGHLSYSQIDCYQRCPMQYRFRYVEARPQITRVAPWEGTALGAALENIGRIHLSGKPKPTLEKSLKYYRAWITKHSDEVQDWGWESAESVQERGERFLTAFYQEGHVEDLKPQAVEEERTVEIAGVPVKCICDVREENYILDYKVHKNLRYLKVETSLQLSLYAHAWQKERVGYIVFLKEGQKRVEILTATRDLERTRKQLELVVSSVAQAISAGGFAVCNPAENFLCSSDWCDFHADCMGSM